jgi:hypothetical protein
MSIPGYTSFAESMRSDRGMGDISQEFDVDNNNDDEGNNNDDVNEHFGWGWTSSRKNEPSRKRKSTKQEAGHRKQSTATDYSLELRPFNPEDYEYDYLLRFKDPEVEKEYLMNAKKKVNTCDYLVTF